MRRREVITLLGGAAIWPLAARAEQAMPVIGFLRTSWAEDSVHLVAAFRQGLSQTGYVEGRNVAIEYRWAEGQFDRLPALVGDLIRRPVRLLVAAPDPAALAAKAATTTIPIVFQIGGDPVKAGLVASLNRPGGNLTGMSGLSPALGAKRLELLHELVPKTTAVAVLVYQQTATTDEQISELREAARTLGLNLHLVTITGDRDLESAFADLVNERVGGLIVTASSVLLGLRDRIVALAARHAIAAIYENREFAAAGGLMSYGTDRAAIYKELGVYAGRILNGEKPGDLPVMQPTKFELVINVKTAKVLGLAVPSNLLALADEVIE